MGPSGGFIVVWESLGQDGDDFGIFGRRHNASGTPQAAEFQVNLHTLGVQRGPSIAITTPGELIVVWRGVRDGGGYEVLGRRIDSGELQGDELQINAYTSLSQTLSAIAGAPDGTFGVVWQSPHDGAPAGIFGRRFDSVGAPLTAELQINAYTAGTQTEPDLATDGAGFVVVWQSAAEDGDSDGIFARRTTSSGALQGAEFQVNTYTPIGQRQPSVAASASGDFVVVWQTFPNQDGSGYGIFGRAFSSAGVALASEFQVNTYTPDYQRYAVVAASAAGDFVVAWASRGQDGSSYGVFARRFSSSGAPLASDFQVNTYTTGQQAGGNRGGTSVAMHTGGDFVVAWWSVDQDGSSTGVFASRFSSAGAPLATEFQVNTYTPGGQDTPSVATDADGDFVVTWHGSQDGSGSGIFARRFSSAGSPLATEFQVNTYTPSYQRSPSVGADADGDFVVTWMSSAQDGSAYGIFAQRFAAPSTLDIDGNGATQPLTDGLLVLRAFFGFTGNPLISGAVDLSGCKRCDAAAIEPYIDGLGLLLDVDGDLALGPLTDGLLALRFLFGFTGNTLINNAVDNDDCERCDAMDIEDYLTGLTD
jgi:hypothetical protein